MHCGNNYPDEPPTIQFVSQVNLPCVNPRNGVVDPKQLPCLANWQRNNTLETALIELRRCVVLSSSPLPPVGELVPSLRASTSSNHPHAMSRPRLTRAQDTWPPPPIKRSPSPPRAPSTKTPKRTRNRSPPGGDECRRGRHGQETRRRTERACEAVSRGGWAAELRFCAHFMKYSYELPASLR